MQLRELKKIKEERRLQEIGLNLTITHVAMSFASDVKNHFIPVTLQFA